MKAYIRARDIGLDLPLYTQEQRSIRATSSLFLRAAFQPPRRVLRTTLDGISFDIEEGERVALVGRNGAGKSTLLKILVGAYPPSRGTLEIAGSRQALLNLSLGFNSEATLVENILLRGIAMGMKPAQAASLTGDVLEFSELEEKAGHRLRTLSSGQRIRLGFALATSMQNEILIMDEWLGAGDASFIKKAKDRIRARVDNARIVVLASHNASLLKSVCNKALLIDEGRLVAVDGVDEVLAKYKELLRPASGSKPAA